MSALLKAAAELQKFCDRKMWSMCFIGGLAVQRCGEPLGRGPNLMSI